VAQVLPDVFHPVSPKFWCSQDESKQKLNAILTGHKDMFDALGAFQKNGNQVTLSAGNHDVDLYWPRIQADLKQEIHPDVKFELGETVYYRYGTRLVIGHGHMYDAANSFRNWKDPIDKDQQRLEMCPGTLFMVKFVNWLEAKFPFSDNVKPVTALGRLLWSEKRPDFKAAAKILFQFTYKNPVTALGMDSANDLEGIGKALLIELSVNEILQEKITKLYHQVRDPNATTETVMNDLSSEERLIDFLKELFLRLAPEVWLPVLGEYEAASLGGDDENSLSILRSGMAKDKENLRNEAIGYLAMESGSYEVVVFGHTHQPDEWRGSNGNLAGGYFNPGSWTRYVDLDKVYNLKLADLENENDFPYQLNFIRVEQSASGTLRADKICFEEASGARFAPTPKPTKYLKATS